MPGSVNNDDILTALNQVIQAVNDLETATTELNVTCTPEITVSPEVTCSPDVTVNCGDGVTGGGPLTDPPAVEGQDPEGEGGPGGGGLPPGFEGTIEEYNAYKCNAANLLVDSYFGYISRWQAGVLSIAQNATRGFGYISTILFAGSALLALLPFAVIPVLIAYVIALVLGTLGLSGILYLYLQWLNDHKGEIVCALFEAQTVEGARAALLTELDPTGIEGFPNGFVEINVNNLFTNSVLNILFENYAPAENYTGSINCQTCGCEFSLEFFSEPGSSTLLGSGDLTVNGESRTLAAVQASNGDYYVLFQPEEGCCNLVVTVDDIDITPVSGSVVYWHNSENCAGQPQIPYGTPASLTDQVVAGQLVGWGSRPGIDGGPFTITVTMEEPA